MTRRRWVVVGASAALVLAVLIWLHERGASTEVQPETRRSGATVRLGGGTSVARPPPTFGSERHLPPPPADFDPGSTRVDVTDPRLAETLARGDLPVTPPGFADAATRARFRAWWLEESARRTTVYRQRFPSTTLPNEDETRRLLEEMYDAGEPPRAGETAEGVDARHQRWFERWQDFTAAYGEPPMGVFSYGGDPAFGTGAPVPDLPAGHAPVPDTTRPTFEDDPTRPRTPMGTAGPR
ncbi:hypothetical protein BH11MYX3_BH11MYX3_13970 [soil metagenome]